MSDENNINVLEPTMNSEDVEAVSNLLNDIQQNSEQLSQVYDIMNSDEDIVETGETRLVNTIIDPATGFNKIINSDEVTTEDSFTDLIDKELNFSLDESPVTIDEIKKYLDSNDAKEDILLQDKELNTKISTEDLSKLMDLVNRYQAKEKIDSLFNKLPLTFQCIINSAMGTGSENNKSIQAKTFRNNMAEMLLDQVLSSITMERANKSINSGIEKIFNQTTAEIGDTIVGYTEERNKKYRDYIEENITDPERKSNAIKVLDSIESTTKLTELKEFCKKCKIRKIDVEHPNDKNKDIDHILSKYDGNKTFNIYNIYNAQQVLERNINTDEVTYSSEQCRAFLIAFSRYCMNFNINNTEEHIFMFYTIYNILLTDVNKGEKAEVSKEFLCNIRECIENLIQRNPFLSTK